jgi:predicted PurR-regulated permease PerM
MTPNELPPPVMTPAEFVDESTGPTLSSGPLVWAATIVFTTLLLALLEHVLWLVVPSLLAIIVYYALFPLVRRLTLAGVQRATAAAVVAGVVFVGAAIAMVPVVSWIAAHAGTGQELLYRYLDAGWMLVDRMVTLLDARFEFLARMNFHGQFATRLAGFVDAYLQKQAGSVLLGAAAWLPSLLLAPFFAFFFLRDGKRFLKFIGSAVPNAYFERTLDMIERVHTTARAYMQGLLKLTAIDTVCLGVGLWALGVPGAPVLGLLAAVLAWVPFVGPIIAGIIVVLVTATDLPHDPDIVYAVIALLVCVRLLDDFVFMPLTVGRSVHMHPLPTVLLIFIGGAVAGIPGLILALPLSAVVMVVAGTIGGILDNPRLRARHASAQRLRARRASADLMP